MLAYTYSIALCAARLRTAINVSYLPCVKTDVKAREMIRNCGLVYFTDRENFISQLLSVLQWRFGQNNYSDQIFIPGEMTF